MAETKNKNKPIPSLSGYGGVRTLQRNLEKSTTLAANREAVAYSLLCMANTKITDVMEWDDKGNVHGSVCPKLIPMNDSLYGISDATNALKITSSILGDTTIVGAGAGKIETGFALYNDIISIVNG